MPSAKTDPHPDPPCITAVSGGEPERPSDAARLFDAAALTAWFRSKQRDLPWRRARSPWRVWVSEIMLQQTQAAAVIPFFLHFMTDYPTPADLAAAPEDQVLKHWEGLGYYARARNLQKGAQVVLSQYGGKIPGTYAELIRIPGIGDYTAGAILSFAFGQPCPAVDGNVVRVLARLTDSTWTQGDLRDRRLARSWMSDFLNAHPGHAPAVSEGLIELGATVCKPRSPDCGNCPLAAACRARQSGRAAQLPRPQKRQPKPVEYLTVLVLEDADSRRFRVRKRPPDGLLGGLWEFPVLDGHAEPAAVILHLEETGLRVLDCRPLPPHRHVFTHLIWDMIGYRILVTEPRRSDMPGSEASETVEPYESGALTGSDGEKTFCALTEPELFELPLASAIAPFRKDLRLNL